MDKMQTTLRDLAPDQPIEIERPDGPTIFTTPRELIEVARLPWFPTLDQVEFAFGAGIG